MKVLGFVFSSKPGVGAHVDYMSKKYRRALWSLHHLKGANLPVEKLVLVYCSMLRAIIEFCQVIYHSMLTEEQNNNIEKLQKMALQIIYGFGISYAELLEKSGLETLQVRRERAFLKFAITLSGSARYSHWFPECDNSVNLRRGNRYQEHYARTSRLYKSPLFSMRRLLNKEENNNEERTVNEISDINV